jgi:phage-related protein
MPLTFNFPVQEETKNPVTRLKSLTYGDGYTHDSPDGINTLNEQWDLTLRPLRKSDSDTFENALNGLNGDWFYWTPPGESQGKYKLIKLERRRSAKDGDAVILTLTIKRVYIP